MGRVGVATTHRTPQRTARGAILSTVCALPSKLGPQLPEAMETTRIAAHGRRQVDAPGRFWCGLSH